MKKREVSDAQQREILLGNIGSIPSEPQVRVPDESLRLVKKAELDEELPILLTRLLDDRGRWILIAEFGEGFGLYVQFLATEGRVLIGECVSNDSVPAALSVDQEEALPLLGWEWPQPPNKPNWSMVDELPDAAVVAAGRVARTLNEVFGCAADDEVLLRLFHSSNGSSDPDVKYIVKLADRQHFSEGRLDRLLRHWRPGSVRYMIEHGFSLDETEQWVSTGLSSPHLVKQTIAAGGTIDQATRLVATGIPPDAVPAAVQAHPDSDAAQKWGASGLDGETLKVLLSERASPDVVSTLLSAGATPDLLRELPLSRLSTEQALAWVKSGVRHAARDYVDIGVEDPPIARRWEQEGFTPVLIGGFVKAGLTPEEATRRVQAGFTDADVRRHRSTPPLAGVAWNRVIRRSRADGMDFVFLPVPGLPSDVAQRFWYAVDCLTVSSKDSWGMISSSSFSYFFADGGVYRVDGMGWGSHSGTWIRGTKALRLICGRMGLTQPRRLKGETARPDIAQLEAELRTGRAT